MLRDTGDFTDWTFPYELPAVSQRKIGGWSVANDDIQRSMY